jgi:hypothetical protein
MTLLCKSYLMLGGLQWLWARSVLLHWIILDRSLDGASTLTAQLRRPAALASCVLFVIAVLWHPSEHGTRSRGKHLLVKEHIPKLNWTNRVGSFSFDKCIAWWNSIGHIEETRQSWNYNCKIAKQIHIRQFDLTYIYNVVQHNSLNCQQRTSKLPNITNIPGMTTSC